MGNKAVLSLAVYQIARAAAPGGGGPLTPVRGTPQAVACRPEGWVYPPLVFAGWSTLFISIHHVFGCEGRVRAVFDFEDG